MKHLLKKFDCSLLIKIKCRVFYMYLAIEKVDSKSKLVVIVLRVDHFAYDFDSFKTDNF